MRKVLNKIGHKITPTSWLVKEPVDPFVSGKALIGSIFVLLISTALTFALVFEYHMEWTSTVSSEISPTLLAPPFQCEMLSSSAPQDRLFIYSLPPPTIVESASGTIVENYTQNWMYLINGYIYFQNPMSTAYLPSAFAVFFPSTFEDVASEMNTFNAYVKGAEYYPTYQACLDAFKSSCRSPQTHLSNFRIAYGATKGYNYPFSTNTYFPSYFFNYPQAVDAGGLAEFNPLVSFNNTPTDSVYSSTCFYRPVFPSPWSGCDNIKDINDNIITNSPIAEWNCNTSQETYYCNSAYSYPLFIARYLGNQVDAQMCMNEWNNVFCGEPLLSTNAASYCQVFDNFPPYMCEKNIHKTTLEVFNLAIMFAANVFGGLGLVFGWFFAFLQSRRLLARNDTSRTDNNSTTTCSLPSDDPSNSEEAMDTRLFEGPIKQPRDFELDIMHNPASIFQRGSHSLTHRLLSDMY